MSKEADQATFLTPDAWLTSTLGIDSFALRLPVPGSAPLIHQVLRTAAGGGDRAFFFGKVAVVDTEGLSTLQQAGFRLIETQITFAHHRAATIVEAAGVPVRRAEQRDKARVLEIASTSFKFSRFHRDPLIGRQTANQIKRLWAENCLNGVRGTEVLVAGIDEAVGFLAVMLAGEPHAPTAVIDLVAVDEREQGRGVGSALVREFVRRWQTRAATLVVGTQLSNTGSLRLYEACGFRFRGAAHLLHAHLDRGRFA
jgi:dTDP-4-amino-4,6-dideoxy-D-galactose acyltransferase